MMMTSPSEPEIRRAWSILPVRALLDRKMNEPQLRALAALCIYTNSFGVCYPALRTLAAILGKDLASVSRIISRLEKRGYVRKLRAQDYQHKQFGNANRYQVLYEPDAPLPSWEEVQTAALLIAPDDQQKEVGGLGGEKQSLTHAISLASAYATAVERTTGQFKRADQELGAANRLASKGFSVQQVQQATQEVARAALAKRAGVPALADVERHLMVETTPP